MITIEAVGARLYVIGNTYPIKEALRSAGAHWDSQRKQWWIGKAKRAEIEAAIAPADNPAEEGPYSGPVQGKATYKDRSYFVRWAGITKTGKDACHLVTLDGKISFFADASLCQWTKRYGRTRGFTGYSRASRQRQDDIVYPTLAVIRDFVANEPLKAEPAPTKTCWECGHKFTRADAREHGDWQDSYCGC